MSVKINVLGRLACLVKEAVERSVDVVGNEAPERNYGYLAVIDNTNGDLLMLVKIGDVPMDKVNDCKKFALEKAHRTYKSRRYSSWESRNFAAKEFGGGISTSGRSVAFSGLKEYADEAVCLDATRKIGWLPEDTFRHITDISSQCTDYAMTSAEFFEALQAA